MLVNIQILGESCRLPDADESGCLPNQFLKGLKDMELAQYSRNSVFKLTKSYKSLSKSLCIAVSVVLSSGTLLFIIVFISIEVDRKRKCLEIIYQGITLIAVIANELVCQFKICS